MFIHKIKFFQKDQRTAERSKNYAQFSVGLNNKFKI